MGATGAGGLSRHPVAGDGERGWLRPWLAPGATAELIDAGGGGEAALLAMLPSLLQTRGRPLRWTALVLGSRTEREYVAEVAASASLEVRHEGAGIAVESATLERLRPVLEEAGVRGRLALVMGVDAEPAGATTPPPVVMFLHPAGEAWAVGLLLPPGLDAASGPAVPLPDPRRSAETRRLNPVTAGVAATVLALVVAVLALALHGRGDTQAPPPSPTAAVAPATAPALDLTLRPGTAPEARQRPAAAIDASSRATVLFGGSAQRIPSADLDDTWLFDGTRWTAQTPAHRPPGRSGAVMASGNLGVFLVGGSARDRGSVPFTDTWVWNGTDWLDLTADGPAYSGHPVAVAEDTQRNQMIMVTETASGGILGGSRTLVWHGGGWVDAGVSTPNLQWIGATAGHGIVALALSPGEVAGAAVTWRWTGAGWIPVAPPQEPAVDPLTAILLTPPGGGALLVESDFLTQAGPSGGTWTFDGSTWSRHGAPIPFFLRDFDVTAAVAGLRAGMDPVLIGGGSGDDAYRRAATWDGSTWRDLGAG